MGIISSLFGGNKNSRSHSQMTAKQILEVVGNFGSTLEHSAPAPGCVADTNELPYPKSQIKDALIAVLRTTGDPNMKEALKTSYICLADWQDGVGTSHVGLDLSSFDLQTNIHDLAERLVNQSDEIERWQSIVAAERAVLRNELVQLGMWT